MTSHLPSQFPGSLTSRWRWFCPPPRIFGRTPDCLASHSRPHGGHPPGTIIRNGSLQKVSSLPQLHNAVTLPRKPGPELRVALDFGILTSFIPFFFHSGNIFKNFIQTHRSPILDYIFLLEQRVLNSLALDFLIT